MHTIDPETIPHHILHGILLTAIAPRPIALASTIDSAGNPNLAPFSCFNVFGVNPSTLIFSPSRSGRHNSLKDTYLNVKEVPEVVINVVTYQMVEQMNLASTEFPKGENEFAKAGFTQVQSDKIRPFRVKESPVQIECRVRETIETGSGPGAANLIICEVLMIHVAEEVLNKKQMIDTRKLNLVGRMGGNYYVCASEDALFQLPKPANECAIGVDSLPDSIRLSKVLSGNDLGKLAGIQNMPSPLAVEQYKESAYFKSLKDDSSGDSIDIETACHNLAKGLIAEGLTNDALLLLLATEVL